MDASDNIYVTTGNIVYKFLAPDYEISEEFSGSLSLLTQVDGVGASAGFEEIRGMAIDKNANIMYISDRKTIRTVCLGKIISNYWQHFSFIYRIILNSFIPY